MYTYTSSTQQQKKKQKQRNKDKKREKVLLKDLQRHVDLMELLTALLDVLESRDHEIACEETTKGVSGAVVLSEEPLWRRHSQFLVEDGLAARLEVTDDDPQLANVLYELLQVFLQAVEFFSHFDNSWFGVRQNG